MTRLLLALLLVLYASTCVVCATEGFGWMLIGVAQASLVGVYFGEQLSGLNEHEAWLASFEERHSPSVPGALPKEK